MPLVLKAALLFLKEDVSEEVMYSLLIFPHSVMSKGVISQKRAYV